VKALTTRRTIRLSLHQLLRALNPILRGWASYFRFTAAKRTFAYLGYYAWWRVIRWLRKKHPKMTWKWLRRRYRLPGPPSEAGLALYNPAAMHVLRYRYRGARSPLPGTRSTRPLPDTAGWRSTRPSSSAGCRSAYLVDAHRHVCGEPGAQQWARRVRRSGPGKRIAGDGDTAPWPDPTPPLRSRGRQPVLPTGQRPLRARQPDRHQQQAVRQSAQVPGNVCAVGSSLHRFGWPCGRASRGDHWPRCSPVTTPTEVGGSGSRGRGAVVLAGYRSRTA
jgi:hypothetical protein